MGDQTSRTATRGTASARPAARPRAPSPAAVPLVRLQMLAGNRAVAGLLGHGQGPKSASIAGLQLSGSGTGSAASTGTSSEQQHHVDPDLQAIWTATLEAGLAGTAAAGSVTLGQVAGTAAATAQWGTETATTAGQAAASHDSAGAPAGVTAPGTTAAGTTAAVGTTAVGATAGTAIETTTPGTAAPTADLTTGQEAAGHSALGHDGAGPAAHLGVTQTGAEAATAGAAGATQTGAGAATAGAAGATHATAGAATHATAGAATTGAATAGATTPGAATAGAATTASPAGATRAATPTATTATPTPTPTAPPGLTATRRRITTTATRLAAHRSPAAAAADSLRAAPNPGGAREAVAKAHQTEQLAAAQPRAFDRQAFIDAVNAAIAQQQPRTLEDADNLGKSGGGPGSGAVASAVRGTVSAGQQVAAAPVAEAAQQAPDASKVPTEEVTPLRPTPAPPTPNLNAAEAMPTPLPPAATDLRAGPAEVSGQMAQAGVTEQQLARSNEPELTGALTAKKAGEAHAATAPAQTRAQEAATLATARAGAQAKGTAAAATMTGTRTAHQGKASASQQAAAARAAEVKARVSGEIHRIFDATKSTVDGILTGIDAKVTQQFVTGEKAASAAFQAFHEREMAAFRERRYGGPLGWTDWLADKLTSPPPEVNQIITRARAEYTRHMNALVGAIADTVAAELGRASQTVAKGREQIAAFLASRPAGERQVAQQAATEVGSSFEALESSIDEKAGSLAEDLATRYVEASAAVDSQVEAMREANKGLIDRAKDAVGGAITTILQLKDMLTGVLARAANAVGKIIDDPIGFLGNFVGAVKAGITRFVGNIGSHLKKGLQDWLFGALAEAGIAVPETLDLKGVITLVLSLLGATWANLRQRIVAKIGEPAMAAVEKGVEVVQLLASKGVAGLWEWLQDKVTSLYERVMEEIKDFVITKVITAGITWLISLLNPAAAFIKACKMIYDAVMWFVENAARMKDFVDSVLDSVESIARGGVGAVASLIENTMARTVPMIISGLASLLGLGGIAAKVRAILEKVQKPVGKLLDGIVGTAVKFGNKALKGLKKLTGKKKRGADDGAARPGQTRAPGQHPAGQDHDLAPAVRAGQQLLTTKDATPDTVRAGLPGLISDHHLKGATLKEAEERYVIEVQRQARSTKPAILTGAIPSKRYLPPAFLAQISEDSGKRHKSKIRSQLYELGSGWGSAKRTVMNEGLERIRQQTRKPIGAGVTGLEQLGSGVAPPALVTAFRQAHARLAATPGRPTTLPEGWFDGWRARSQQRWEVDHVVPLAAHWKSGGNDQGDGAREKACSTPSRLQFLTREENRKKGAGGVTFAETPWVGPRFTSFLSTDTHFSNVRWRKAP